jgi:hypothetical protein
LTDGRVVPAIFSLPMRGTVVPWMGVVQGGETHGRRHFSASLSAISASHARCRFLSSGRYPPDVADGSDLTDRILSSAGSTPTFSAIIRNTG